MKVKDAMTADVLTIPPGMSLKTAAALMAGYAIGGLPVLDREGTLLGVLTEADILHKERAEQPRGGLRTLLHRHEAHAMMSKVAARTVGEAMTAPAITVGPRSSVGSAADLMFEHGINRLPVLDHGKLVGIITRHDLVQAFARSDAEIERDIRTEAFAGLTAAPITLRVDDGEVTVRGEVDSAYDAAMLPDLIRRVPGVVAVDSELRAWDPERSRKVLVTMHRD